MAAILFAKLASETAAMPSCEQNSCLAL